MTEKRFKLISINEQYVSANLYDNGTFIGSIENGEELIVEVLNQLSDENEQLKQSIKEVIELLSEEVDVFSEKATEHDIIAYRELNQLDNKDAYYMATATKKAIKMLKEGM